MIVNNFTKNKKLVTMEEVDTTQELVDVIRITEQKKKENLHFNILSENKLRKIYKIFDELNI